MWPNWTLYNLNFVRNKNNNTVYNSNIWLRFNSLAYLFVITLSIMYYLQFYSFFVYTNVVILLSIQIPTRNLCVTNVCSFLIKNITNSVMLLLLIVWLS